MVPVAGSSPRSQAQKPPPFADLRFGQRGSISVDLVKCVWYDHENDEGGGWIDLYRLVYGRDPGSRPVHRSDDPVDDPAQRSEVARRVWDESQSAAGTMVERYLRARSILLPPPDELRYHRKLYHAPSGTHWPAMVGAVRDSTGEIVAVHRTWLHHMKPDKAPVVPAKMTLGPVKGCAIRLARPGTVLVIAEGIETALSVAYATDLPAWSAIFAGNMHKLSLPPIVEVETRWRAHDPRLQTETCPAQRGSGRGHLARFVAIRCNDHLAHAMYYEDADMKWRSIRDALAAAQAVADPVDLLIKEFNAKYMVVNEAWQVVIYQPMHDDVLNRRYFQRITFADFRRLHMNRSVEVSQDAQRNVAEVWLRHPERQQYIEGVRFLPNGEAPPGILNLWQGFAVEPCRGSWEALRGHVYWVICRGYRDYYGYLVGWMANLFQHPDK